MTIRKVRNVQRWRVGSSVDVFDIVSPAEEGSLHFHSTYNIGLVLEGDAQLVVGGQTIPQPRNAIVLLNAYEPHASSWYSEYNRYFVIQIADKAWGSFAASLGCLPDELRLKGPIVYDTAISDALSRFHENLRAQPGSVNSETIGTLLTDLYHRNLACRQEVYSTHLLSDTLGQKLSLDPYHGGERCIEKIAGELGVSRYKLARSCKGRWGMQPRRVRIQLMVANAQFAISAGVCLVEAAMQAGFSDQSHMNREFRRTIGMTPREYQCAVDSGALGNGR